MSVASAGSLLQHREMRSRLKDVLLISVIGLAGLAVAAGAQTTGSSSPKVASRTSVKHHARKTSGRSPAHAKSSTGEAASLERSEAGQTSDDVREDNRGRLTSARLSKHPKQASNAVYHGPSNGAARQTNVRQQGHTAQLKTGQLTSRQSAHMVTKRVALPHTTHSGRGQGRKLAAEEPASPPGQEHA
jgi:hypothetical protein